MFVPLCPPYPYPLLCQRHARRRTDLIDDSEDGVGEHQVTLLQRQIVGLLQSKQHCTYQGDLRGT